ncbi:MAG: STAS domain-containing protein [Anaeromyxobacter sp.]
MMDVTRGARGETVVRIDGTFDAPAAARLSAWLGELPEATPLVIDFTRVRQLLDVGVAVVAPRLVARRAIQLVGLGRHQERLFRYLGLDTSAEYHGEAAG